MPAVSALAPSPFQAADPVQRPVPDPVPTLTWRASLRQAYDAVRARTESLAAPLSPEDQCVQSMPDASPVKWHLGHTTWFFETFVLTAHVPGHKVWDDRFSFLFNSYYEALGARHPRPARGLLTRPAAHEVLAFRHAVDDAVRLFIAHADEAALRAAEPALTLGLHHEQQHQELILTDVLHLLAQNPLGPAWRPPAEAPAPGSGTPMRWVDCPGGEVTVGHRGDGFAFDNEGPAHAVLLRPYRLADRPVSCGEYLGFIRAGGYRDPQWWLSDGWAAVKSQGWTAPMHWADAEGDRPERFTLFGWQPVREADPVCHLSFFEAAAYAAWAGARLPTEFEWEAAVTAHGTPVARTGADVPWPCAAPAQGPALRGVGEVWEWTRSSYDPYPGFKPFAGPAAEYNGKFMVSQVVLRGGSCATPPGHARASYRNFFSPGSRWQFSGLRLAQDL